MYQKSKINFTVTWQHSLRHYCYIISSQIRECFEILLNFFLSVPEFLKSISTAQQSLSNIKLKENRRFERSGKKTYFTTARKTPQQCTSRRCLAHPIGRVVPQFAHRYPNTKNLDRKSKTQCKITNLFFLRENSVGLERMHAILSQKQDQIQRGQQQTLYKQQQSPLLLQPKGGLNVFY